ncbi:MAG: hypothetical protein EHM64_13880, partial [Ignavibacteriae bacterium]
MSNHNHQPPILEEKRMKKLLYTMMALGAFCLLSTTLLVAQNVSSSAIWPESSTTARQAQVSGQIQADSLYLTKDLLINGYTGPSSSQRIKMNAWPVNQLTQIDSVYFQYTVSPKTSYNMIVDSLVLSLGANSTQDMMANLYYSKDPTFATKTKVEYTTSVAARLGKPAGVFLNSSKLDTLRSLPNLQVNEGEKFYFRVYPWVDSSTSVSGKYVCPQNVKIYATAVPIPISASALWLLHTKSAAPTVSGLLTADNMNFDGTDLYNYGYSATTGARWTTTLPSKGAWPAETAPNFSRYAQFSVGPQTGGTFKATSLVFNMLYEFTTTLRTAVYYSTDSTFATKTFIADTAVPATMTTYSYPINATAATGEKIYVRFYPYNLAANAAYKLVDVDSVLISGSTTGLAILPPTITTTNASYISTTFFTTGGTVSADGGGAVTARGVCWNTSTAPTTANSVTVNGTGLGSFTSSVSGLTAGTKYYLRAYATNVGGTSYGSEIAVTTLASVIPPTVTTTAISNIMVTTATSGGNVTEWGGDSVLTKGICWNKDTTAGYPSITNSKTIDGSDFGSFTSSLTGLSATTVYFVRAYATNSAGTNYGALVSFTTQTPKPDTTVVVAKDGSGNYTTLQAAFNAVPLNYTGKWTIFVKKGIYTEKDTLAAGKVNVSLIGENRDSTIISFGDYADSKGSGNPGTSGCFTIAIDASDFTAKNITFENTYWPNKFGIVGGTQGVALRTQGDRHEFINCRMLGYQDTYYTWGGSGTGRSYHKNCIIQGSVDYIFGRNICVFDSCRIVTNRSGGTITAGSTDATSLYGYVFRNCTLATIDTNAYDGNPVTSFYLGRPWQANPRAVY